MNEREIFTAVREIPDSSARDVFLDLVCARDDAIRKRVQRLLAASEWNDCLLDRQVVLSGSEGGQVGFLPFRPDGAHDETAVVSRDRFTKLLLSSGVIGIAELHNLIDSSPEVSNDGCQALADELVRRRKLTSFQAHRLCQGQSLVVGSYVIVDRLGEGGMGTVVKAEHRGMKRLVALKFLTVSQHDRSGSILRFQREVEAAAKLQHHNIVSAFDAGEVDGHSYLAMEYVAGIDLCRLVKLQGPLSVGKSLACIIAAARALEFAHRNGVIHRDVKPSNLMLDRQGTLKLLDLGLARIVGDASPASSMTASGIVMGTGDYLSPEQARNAKVADARSDIYSLGMSLWYLLTGAPAYGGESLVEKLLAHREAPIPLIGSVRSGIADRVEFLFRKMVAKNPQDRFQSMREVISAAEACLHDEPGNGSETGKAGAAGAASAHWTLPPSHPTDRDLDTRNAHFEQAVTESTRVAALKSRPSDSRASPNQQAPPESEESTRVPHPIHEPSSPRWMRRVGRGAGGFAAAILLVALIVITTRPNQSVKDDVSGSEGGRLAFPTELRDRVDGRTQPAAATASDHLQSANEGSPDAEFQKWTAAVAALPAQEQLEAVRKELMIRNRGFDGNLDVPWHGRGARPLIVDGVVTEIGFLTDQVTDISPIRALSGLRALWCGGYPDRRELSGKLTDLSPLKGMALESLVVMYNRELRDISPLAGMQLTHLDIRRTQVSDLKPLQGMPLDHLDMGTTLVTDLSPLQGAPLTFLHLMDTAVSDLSPLKNLPLTYLSLRGTRVNDLTALRGMPLELLDCHNTSIGSLELLRGMKITHLTVSQTKVTDLSPLRGMPLVYLNAARNAIPDLSPLKDMALETLDIHRTPVADLSPLNGMRLKVLNMEGVTRLTDIAPLRDMPLKDLRIEYRAERDKEILLSLRTLERINESPAANFWKAVEANSDPMSR